MEAVLDIDGNGKITKVHSTEDSDLIAGKVVANAKAGDNQTLNLVKLPPNPKGYEWAVKKEVQSRRKEEKKSEALRPMAPPVAPVA